LTVHLLTLVGLTPEPKVTRRGVIYYPCRCTILQNFSTIAQTVYEICVTKVFHFLAPGGLTPVPKFTKGEMTCGTPRSTSLPNFITRRQSGPEISLTKVLRTHTKKQTVNDISTTCLSACVDKNGNSYDVGPIGFILDDLERVKVKVTNGAVTAMGMCGYTPVGLTCVLVTHTCR